LFSFFLFELISSLLINIGLRFECLNCPSYDLCDDCEVFSQNFHEKSHTFKIIREGPDNEVKLWRMKEWVDNEVKLWRMRE
jgi:hypothetical protein